MNRRRFLRLVLGMYMGWRTIGCSDESATKKKKQMNIHIPTFSKARLHQHLDRLLNAYESKGMRVGESLLPGVSEAELIKKCAWFPGDLIEEIVALYEWRGGQAKDAWETEFPFWFRDHSFCSLESAASGYKCIMDSYGKNPADHQMLKHAFPIASFDGSWYVIPTRAHNLDAAFKRPVISVHEGVDIYFYSLEKMVETCVEWVSHENYSTEGLYPESLELEIWRKHNPGVFS